MSVRVALADDQALVRAGLRALLKAQQVEVVFEADDGADLQAAQALVANAGAVAPLSCCCSDAPNSSSNSPATLSWWRCNCAKNPSGSA